MRGLWTVTQPLSENSYHNSESDGGVSLSSIQISISTTALVMKAFIVILPELVVIAELEEAEVVMVVTRATWFNKWRRVERRGKEEEEEALRKRPRNV